MVNGVWQVKSPADQPDAPIPRGQEPDPTVTGDISGLPQPQTLPLMHEGGRNSPSEGVAFPNHLLPPSILREFERAAPGAAERLLQLLEAEQKERHESDAEEQRQRFILQCLALALGFTLSMAGLGVALVVCSGRPPLGGWDSFGRGKRVFDTLGPQCSATNQEDRPQPRLKPRPSSVLK